ncbi:unnamed protein product, partial [Iphiclides podalirius]
MNPKPRNRVIVDAYPKWSVRICYIDVRICATRCVSTEPVRSDIRTGVGPTFGYPYRGRLEAFGWSDIRAGFAAVS